MPCPVNPASKAKEINIVSSIGVIMPKPACARIEISNFILWPIFNIPHLLKSVAIVKEKIPEVFLNIIGTGTLQEDLEKMVLDLNLKEHVRFLGKVPQTEIALEMNASHAFVSVSLSDGNNISLNEAMACNTFSVATNIPANKQWIKHGVNGFLIVIDDIQEKTKI